MLGRTFELTVMEWIHNGRLTAWENNLFSVGGFVRDFLINRESHDVDLMVTIPGGAEKLAQDFMVLFKDQITTPIQMGAVYPIWSFEFKSGEFKDLKIDIADSQKEMFPKNDQRQRVTSYGDFNEDIQRRDFTVNMLARNLTTDEIIDQSGCGQIDLQQKILRTHPNVDAAKILSDDPLRIIRAVRFACTHDFKIEQALFKTMQDQAERIKIVSAERILLELTKITASEKFTYALELFLELKMMSTVFTETVEKMLLDANTMSLIQKILKRTEKRISYQLSGLFYFLNQSEIEVLTTKLKLSHTLKKEIVTIISLTEKLLLMDSQSFVEVRSFLRSCDLKIEELVRFASGVSIDFDVTGFMALQKKCSFVAISKKPLLDGHEISELLGVSGPDIKKAQDILFKIEDQYILENSQSPSKEWAREQLLKKTKT